VLTGALTTVDWSGWFRRQIRHPLNHLLASVLALMAAIAVAGKESVSLFGHHVRLYPPHNLVTLAYALFFLRLVSWWRGPGRTWIAGLDHRVGDLLVWHAWPVAVSFLLPKRLSTFLWYLSPANFPGEVRPTLAQSSSFYAAIALDDYHFARVGALLGFALLGFALLAGVGRRLRPGALAVLCLFLLGTWLTVSHPCLQGRYLHSWFAAGWVAAGIGLASALQVRLLARRPLCQSLLAAGLLIVLGAGAAAGLTRPGHAPEGGPELQQASILDVTDGYLEALNGAEPVTILSAVPFRFLSEWTYTERYGTHARLDSHWFGFGSPGESNRQGFQRWLATTRCATLVFVERLPGAGDCCYTNPKEPECLFHEELAPLLQAQTTFRLIERQDHPQHGLSVTIWRR
jgi:hypothetical protein